MLLPLQANPLLSSWFTAPSGQYARIYEDNDAVANQTPVTTWNRGLGVQVDPVYAGITEISHTTTDVYIRTSNLGFHVMGPWYGGNNNLFPNYPANRAEIYRFPRNPVIPATRIRTDGGAIGYGVDGVALFDSRDAFSYDTSAGVDETPMTAQDPAINGDGVWNRDAYINEGDTFDPAFAHQAGSFHHYHANMPALRHLLGDSVSYDPVAHSFTESPNGDHSPIIGWFRDGFPLYGPYGYSDPNDAHSGVRRMVSGYQKRDGSNGSTDLNVSSRGTVPQWVVRNEGGSTTLAANRVGPAVSAQYPLGHYMQDYAFKGDLGLTQYSGSAVFDESIHFDLNEYNVRFCVTPEFPEGTFAYFTNIEPDGTPVFPYNIARYYFGDPSGMSPNDVPNDAVVVFEGGPKRALSFDGGEVDGDEVTMTWSAIEGGEYVIDSSTTLQGDSWSREANEATPVGSKLIITESGDLEERDFYRIRLSALAPFDDNGIVDFSFVPVVTHVFQFPTDPPLPELVTSVTIGGVSASVVSYNSVTGFLEVGFDDSSLAPGDYPAVINGAVSSSNVFNVAGANNVLLLIIDDWGIDASELYNTQTGPGIQLANMPHLKSLADNGLLFTRGYAQPICSPTRATILTGRQPYQHGVGNPNTNTTLPAAEMTFPEIITTGAPGYGLASFGKWHLGSGDTGPFDTGGWPNFSGTLQGGVQDYNDWNRIKIESGVLVDSGTDIDDLVSGGVYASPYATSVQVDEAVSFIDDQGGDPWVVWMGFNAPHDPFHDPPASLAPVGGYSTMGNTNKDLYVRMLEALDTEIGRLLESVDLTKSNIIIIGDNGTPGMVDQAPAGGLAAAKGSLNEGGIHVPFFAHGPVVQQKGTTDKLVHVADLFTTVLDLTGVEVPDGLELRSQSLLPIFEGIDTTDRYVVAEKFGINATDGRALMMDDWPEYKLISFQNVSDPNDVPTYQMYLLGADGVEISTLTTPPNSGDPHEAAYDALVAKDQSLEPDVTVPPAIINIVMPAGTPPLINTQNGNIVRPNGITVGGVAADWDAGDITVNGVTTSAARVDVNGDPDQFSVVAEFDVGASGLVSGVQYDVVVSFPGAMGNRVFTLVDYYTAP